MKATEYFDNNCQISLPGGLPLMMTMHATQMTQKVNEHSVYMWGKGVAKFVREEAIGVQGSAT